MADALRGSLLHFVRQEGISVTDRCTPFHEWRKNRATHAVWPYSRVMETQVGTSAGVGDEQGQDYRQVLNFGSQDYLGLAQSPELRACAHEAVDRFGIHSAGSPALCGRTKLLKGLEAKLAAQLKQAACVVLPTGWAAGFGAIAAFAREQDTVLIDSLAHNCLQEGARHATQRIRKFKHNDLVDLEVILAAERETSSSHGMFLVLESLYSMDSDSPNLKAVMELARQFDAIVVLDMAHDFGAMGNAGLGLLETLPSGLQPDIICGAFSKTFASNGGFIAASAPVADYFRYYASPHIFSNAISPLQTAIVNRAFDLVFSPHGDALRGTLSDNVQSLRSSMMAAGLKVAGTPSPIVPVFVGDEAVARLTARNLATLGLSANLVEFPAVARGKARFRFQVMATHTVKETKRAAVLMSEATAQATQLLADDREFAGLTN